MIRDTSVEIEDLYQRWQVELAARHARRQKIRYIDRLLNQLEELNLAEAQAMPSELKREVRKFLEDEGHALAGGSGSRLSIADSMEALYDIQDTLLVGGEADDEL